MTIASFEPMDLVFQTIGCHSVPSLVIQALAAGRPVVAVRVGDVAEVVDDGIYGLIAGPGDQGALAEGIRRSGASPELCEQFGRQGRQCVKAMFSGANTSLSHFKMYRDLLSC